ncbi:MAG: GNAT family N-acetyltransferase [Burkholderiales bacterium]|nr:GNAT family N-acetyltransferase [Burkholderiales bacterium]
MKEKITIQRAGSADAREVSTMAGELLTEIENAIGAQVFNFDLEETTARLEDFFRVEKYYVFIARADGTDPVGFISLFESHSLYAGGAFGTIPELYVRPGHRDREVGLRLLSQAKAFGSSRKWSRLEVTTPPLPQFDRTLQFYMREGFSISGGRKLKINL